MGEPSSSYASRYLLRLVSLAGAWRSSRAVSFVQPRLAWALAAAIGGAVAFYFWQYEGGYPDYPFAWALSLAVGAALVVMVRRVAVAAVLTAGLVCSIRILGVAKQQASEVLLHAYDVLGYLSPWALIDLAAAHRDTAREIGAVLFATGAVALILWRFDSTRLKRTHALAALAATIGLALVADAARGDRRHTEFYFENHYVTYFYASWAETVRALWHGQLIDALPTKLARTNARVFEPPGACSPAVAPPHIILIHQESVVPPAFFPKLSYDHSLDPFFHSIDGKLNKLRVETYGGASWLTEFSVLTGLSTQSFGGMRQSVQQAMAGKIGDTLPQALGRCGYRTVMLYPMLRHFLGAGRFFEATGIGEIIDAKAQGAKSSSERDRFYYANALTEIGRHVKASAQPLFLYVQTMAAHGPYDYAYEPEVAVAGGGPGTHPEMSEYLRRLAMTRMDYASLRAELARRFPRQRFLILHYGDHHPTATQTLLGFGEDASIEDIMASGNEAARLTYYALDAIRYRLPPLPSVATLDVAYLSTVLLEAAGLPLSDTYRERRRLMMLCGGRYYDCPAREEVLRFHRRLIDSGLMKAL